MRPWILATIVLGALAIFLAVREASLSRQINALRREKDDLTVQQGSLAERLAEAEKKLGIKPDQTSPSVPNYANPTVSDNGQLPKRVTALENQVRAIQSRISPEYDPTVDAPEPEADTNAPPKRSWGPEQALGPPDTERDADSITAWTSLDPDGGPEWLALGFDRAVDVAQIRIRESYNPGAITKVTTTVNGSELVLWEGNSARGKAPRDFVVTVPAGVQSNSVIVYLDTKRVAGWNEIDAVELIGRDGTRQWATSANASSTYADRAGSTQVLNFQTILR
jgi:hypothetical protein